MKTQIKLQRKFPILHGTIQSKAQLDDLKRLKREKKLNGKLVFLLVNSNDLSSQKRVDAFIKSQCFSLSDLLLQTNQKRVSQINVYMIDAWETPELFSQNIFGKFSPIISKVPTLIDYRINGTISIVDYFPSILNKIFGGSSVNSQNEGETPGICDEEEEFLDI